MENKRYLILADGSVYEGFAFGADKCSIGELNFNTSAAYNTILTDEANYGQIVIETFPMIGNYGIVSEDFCGKCALSGLVVRESCDAPSNFRCEKTVDEFLREQGVPGIYGVDTRALTRLIREKGSINAVISDEIITDLSPVKEYKITDAVKNTASNEIREYKAENENYRVALIDYGAKHEIIKALNLRGATVTVVPAFTDAEEIIGLKPDGVVLSDGAGDPCDYADLAEKLKKLKGKLPVFGIGFGHCLLALAFGADIIKLKYGHRGSNQPSRDQISGRTYITSQNHGFAVDSEAIKVGEVSFININDNTCEGICYNDYKAFSVQFIPEAVKGADNTSFLFDRFVTLMEEN